MNQIFDYDKQMILSYTIVCRKFILGKETGTFMEVTMGKLIYDGESVYELDEECLREKEKKEKEKEMQWQKEKQRRRTGNSVEFPAQ